jgi:ADP-heptose:LPS heptosyltransferase
MNIQPANVSDDRPKPRHSPLKRLEHAFKRLFFSVMQLSFKRGRGPKGNVDPSSLKRVLFLRPDRLGDMVISLPVFYNLKRRYPHIEIYVLCSPRNRVLIENDLNISGHFLYTKNIFRDIMTMREIRRLRVDAVVDMVLRDSVTSLILSQMVSPRAIRIGLNKFDHGQYYDYNYKLWGANQPHMLDYTLGLLGFFGMDVAELNAFVPPAVSLDAVNFSDRFLSSQKGGEG